MISTLSNDALTSLAYTWKMKTTELVQNQVYSTS